MTPPTPSQLRSPAAYLFAATALAALVLLWSGCRAALPTYPPAPPDETLRTVAQRFESVQTLTAQCRVTLTDADGQTVALDAAMAMRRPDRLRLRAWKFGTAVFDLTCIGDEVWIAPPPAEQARPLPARKIADALRLLGPEYFRTARVIDESPLSLAVSGPGPDGAELRCAIDRSTRAVRRFYTPDEAPGKPASAELKIPIHREVSGILWPKRLTFTHSEGLVTVVLEEIAFNEEIDETALRPPSRAALAPREP